MQRMFGLDARNAKIFGAYGLGDMLDDFEQIGKRNNTFIECRRHHKIAIGIVIFKQGFIDLIAEEVCFSIRTLCTHQDRLRILRTCRHLGRKSAHGSEDADQCFGMYAASIAVYKIHKMIEKVACAHLG